MKRNLIVMLFAIFLFSALVTAVVTTNRSPANFFETTSGSINFSWTATSDYNTTINSSLYITTTGNLSNYALNVSKTCANATNCSVIVSGFSEGFYKWYLSHDDNVDVSVTMARTFEIRESADADYFKWENDTGFLAMKLNKDTGDLWVAGLVNATLIDYYTKLQTVARFVNRTDWTSIDDYPLNCTSGYYVYGIGDTLNCSLPPDTKYSADESYINNISGTFTFNTTHAFNNLAVNRSTFWSGISSFISKWFYNNGAVLTLNETQLNNSIRTEIESDNLDLSGYNVTASIFLGNLNASYIQNPFWIESADEGDLNVNSSDYWDNYDTVNDLLIPCTNVTGATSNLCTIVDTTYTAGSNLTLTGTTFSVNMTSIKTFFDTIYQAIGDYVTKTFARTYYYNKTESVNFFVNRSDWTTIDNYPSACGAGQYVSGIGDTLTCSTPAGGSGGFTTDQNDELNTTGNPSFQNVTAAEFRGAINWTFLQNYPVACPGGTSVTQVNDTITCTEFVSYTVTKNLNMTEKNITDVDCIFFKSGGSICTGS